MSKPETIGIVGAAGDLGSQLTAQAIAWGYSVLTYDFSPVRITGAIDPKIDINYLIDTSQPQGNLEDVINGSQMLHWVAPQSALQEVISLPKDTLLVLHDSVAKNSVNARERLLRKSGIIGEIAIAHCLMNEEKSVVVPSDIDGHVSLSEHIIDLGLVPKLMTTREHDYMMAHTQAPLALLSKVLKATLHEYADHKNFSSVATVLLNVLEARASRWTSETVNSILSNPELPKFVDSLQDATVDFSKSNSLSDETDADRKTTEIRELDYMMARTHAPLILFGKVLIETLRSYDKQGLLTASARDLLGAIELSETETSSQDEATTLSNPELISLIDDFRTALAT